MGAGAAARRHDAADDELLPRRSAALQRVAGRPRARGPSRRRCSSRERARGLPAVGAHERAWKPATRQRRVIALRNLLEEQAQDGLSGLPRGAIIHGAEIPRVDYRLPKAARRRRLRAVGRSRQPRAAGQRAAPHDRAAARLHRLQGLEHRHARHATRWRSGPTATPTCATATSSPSAKRCCRSPPQLAEQLAPPRGATCASTTPDGTDWLLPSPPTGSAATARAARFTSRTHDRAESSSATSAAASIRDRRRAARSSVFTRTCFAITSRTSMVNDNVPLTVIQKVLDHGSIEMTAHYARLHDDTLRREVTPLA